MASRCWTCGTTYHDESGWYYTCPSCQFITQRFQGVQGEIERASEKISGAIARTSEAATEKLSNKFDELIYEQREGFQAVASGLTDIASAVEWGFSELSWQVQQQTDVLQDISRKMDIPSQIQATEWRRMAEELRARGDYNKALEFFQKALESNPLDYQIYIGLGRTYLCLSQFDEAGECFLNSLRHAPQKGDFDYKSYSFRLVARTKYCGLDIDSAISYAEQAVSLSPNYWKAYYDLAQYCAVRGDLSKSAEALHKAIEAEKLYFPMAESERDFAPVRNVLVDMRNEAKATANQAIAEATEALRKAEDANAQVYASAKYENAKSKLNDAKEKMAIGTYEAFLEAKDLASEAIDVAKIAKDAATEKANRRQEEEQKRTLAFQAELKRSYISIGLILAAQLLASFYWIGSFMIGAWNPNPDKSNLSAVLIFGFLPCLTGGVSVSGKWYGRGLSLAFLYISCVGLIGIPITIVLYVMKLKKAQEEYNKDIERIRRGIDSELES